jgi:hypothetical protein
MNHTFPCPDRNREWRWLAGPVGACIPLAVIGAALTAGLDLAAVCLGLLALAATMWFFWCCLRGGRIDARFLVSAWLFGHVVAWVVGLLGYCYLPKPSGYDLGVQITVSMILANLSVWGVILGSLTVLPLARSKPGSAGIAPLPERDLRRHLAVFFWIALGYCGLTLASTSVSARWIPIQAGGIRYYLDSLTVVVYCLFFFLGASMRPGFATRASLLRFGLVALGLVATGFSGGRAYGIRLVIYFLAGMLFSPIPLKRILGGLAKILPVVLVFTFVIGAARGGTNFGEVGLKERLDLMLAAMTGKLDADGELQNYPVFSIFERLAPPQGQTVVDDVVEKGTFQGFINFDRIATIFLPKVVAPDKKSPDDGYERLIEFHNFRDEPGSSAPITFMADAFERGGFSWVFFSSFLLGAWLTLVGRLVAGLRDPCARAVLLVHFAIVCLEMYPRSVIGTLSAVTYGFARDAIVFLVAVQLGLALWVLAVQSRNAAFAALARRMDDSA